MAAVMLRRFPRPCPRSVTKRATPSIKQTSWVMPIPLTCSRKSHAAWINGCGLLKRTPRRPNEYKDLKPRTSVANLRIPTSNKIKLNNRIREAVNLPGCLPVHRSRLYAQSTPDQTVKLSDFRGRPVVLAFYPADWSPVCGDQMGLYNEILQGFQKLGAELLGISVDGAWCHTAFSRERKLHFPLLADFEPKGAVARLYGVYRETDGTTDRALFVINEAGVIHWSYVSPVGVNPGADGILSALEELQEGTK